MNPFDKDFRIEYELALKIGKQRFGSECKHETINNGKCVNCLRTVVPQVKK